MERRTFLRSAALATAATITQRTIVAAGLGGSIPLSAPPSAPGHVLSHVAGGNTVGGEVRERSIRADGYFHIDTPRMIARLKQLRVNNCNYLVWNSPSDWDDLRHEFLPAAETAGIQVWPYIVPPAETYVKGKGSDPYRLDYEKWAQELAQLSLHYRALTAWVMDDFTWNTKTLTPEYMAKLRDITRAINPEFLFFPVVHFTAISDEWIRNYKPYINGVICPYLDLPYNNTQRTASLDTSINRVRDTLNLPLYVLLYAGRHLTSPLEPTPQYVSQAIRIAVRAMEESRCGGIISYGTELDPQNLMTEGNRALEGNSSLFLAAVASGVPAGDFAQASQEITIDPESSKYQLIFWHRDNWSQILNTRGQYFKQILIDETVVWECDAAADNTYWLQGSTLQGPIDLTSELKGRKTARLTLRLVSKSDGPKGLIQVNFDALQATGFTLRNPGFESSEGWRVEDKGQSLLADIDHFSPNLRIEVFNTVSQEFAKAEHIFASQNQEKLGTTR